MGDIWAPATDEPETVPNFPSTEVPAQAQTQLETILDKETERTETREQIEHLNERETLERIEKSERIESRESRETRLERAISEVRRMEREIRAVHELREQTELLRESHTDRLETAAQLSTNTEHRIDRMLERQLRETHFLHRSDRLESRVREIVRQEISHRSEPDVRVEIGRIDVIQTPSAKAAEPKSERKGPIMDLQTYLNQREERR